eukprot:GEMP01023838.1.p1 GENE.GEMP01023838.1~~GEMP01023838.1.p1  ORF type:complete len:384 (+),score=74.56 GEMP01023838.1:83-1234(+)
MASDIPTTMKQMVLVKRHRDFNKVVFRIDTVPVPTPKSGEVLIRMAAAPVNPSDYENWRMCEEENPQDAQEPGEPEERPEPCGSEGSGIVVANGGGLTGWRLIGKRVAVVNVRDGTYQEYVCAPANMVLVLHGELLVESACSVFVNPFTTLGIVAVAKEYDSPCFIHTAGASALGIMLNRVSQELGVTPVNVVNKESQVKLLEELGAKYIVNTSDGDWRTKLKHLITELQITVCFDAIAGPITGTLLSLLPPKSRLYNYGCLSGEPVGNVHQSDLVYGQKLLLGWNTRSWLRGGGAMSSSLRYQWVTNLVLPNLFPGKWAHTNFTDCSLETMSSKFLHLHNTGFTGAKLRIVFRSEHLKKALSKRIKGSKSKNNVSASTATML